MVVDLPAPFGPRKPVTFPGRTSSVRPLTAVLSPYRFVKPRNVITSVLPGLRFPVENAMAAAWADTSGDRHPRHPADRQGPFSGAGPSRRTPDREPRRLLVGIDRHRAGISLDSRRKC